jgi:hypothetical protein
MGIFNFFVGKKDSSTNASVAEARVEDETVRKKYLDALNHFQTAFNVSRRSIGYSKNDDARRKFMLNLSGSLPNFGHVDLIEHVFNSAEHFGRTSQMFEQMEQCLKQPTSTNLKRFDTAKSSNENAIQTNFILAQRASRLLLRNNDFMKQVYNVSNRNNFAVSLFEWYYKLSLIEQDYFKHICNLRDKTAARAAQSASAVFSKS